MNDEKMDLAHLKKPAKAPRSRKANFSTEEVGVLLQEIELEKGFLFAALGPTITQKLKNYVWADIALKVSACGVAERSLGECREKWRALKTAVLEKLQGLQKTSGVGPVKDMHHEEIIKRIINDNPLHCRSLDQVFTNAKMIMFMPDEVAGTQTGSLSQDTAHTMVLHCPNDSSDVEDISLSPSPQQGCSFQGNSVLHSTPGLTYASRSLSDTSFPDLPESGGFVTTEGQEGNYILPVPPGAETETTPLPPHTPRKQRDEEGDSSGDLEENYMIPAPARESGVPLPVVHALLKRRNGGVQALMRQNAKKCRRTECLDVQRSEAESSALWDTYLQSEIDKNRMITKKLALEIRKMEGNVCSCNNSQPDPS